MSKSINILDEDYLQWVQGLCKRYRQSQIEAAVKVNKEMLWFYGELALHTLATIKTKCLGPICSLFVMFVVTLVVCGCDAEKTYNVTVSANPIEGGSVISVTGPVEEGTSITFRAMQNGGYLFSCWSGSLDGNENPKTVTVTGDMNVTANFVFGKHARQYPLQDLSKSSYELKQLYVDEDFSQFTYSDYQMLQVDYNRDGYLDVITALYEGLGGLTDADRIPLGFYLGNPDGTFSKDEKNNRRIQGMLHIRKMIYGDYNNDGFPDIVLLGHGYDTDPWPGEYPVILMSSPSGVYTDIRFKELNGGFYHGGSSGDFDNDGDLDVFILDNFGRTGILVNDGNGNFTYNHDLVSNEWFVSMFNTEFYDIDKDGYLDLICGGHDWEDDSYWNGGDVSYSNCPIVMWGNGVTYKDCEVTRLPATCINGYGLVTDYIFYDLDNDGTEEIIISRTGDGCNGGIPFYAGWAIQVLRHDGRSFTEATTDFIQLSDAYKPAIEYNGWIVRINLEKSELDGKTYLCATYDHPQYPVIEKIFEYTGDKLIPCN